MLRLQLTLRDRARDRENTLTLPAISIPRRANLGSAKEALYLVQVNGHLPVLKNQLASVDVLRRSGTARFGFGLTEPQENPDKFAAY